MQTRVRVHIRRIAALACAAVAALGLWAEAGQAHLAQQVVRLHVLAASNGAEDQALKLRVRDAVLAESARLLDGQASADEAAAVLDAHRTELACAASRAVAEAGADQQVTVCLTESWFPTRRYGDIALPAGTYRALRVELDEGAGRNWWCVVFPSLCRDPVTEPAARAVGLTGPDWSLLTEDGGRYAVRFRAAEGWAAVQRWLGGA